MLQELKGQFERAGLLFCVKYRENQGYVSEFRRTVQEIALKINFLIGNMSKKNPLFCIVLVFSTVSQVLKNYLSIW